jgi:predicted permease
MRVIFDRILNDRVAARAETLSPEEREEVLERTIDLSPGGRGIRNLRDEIGHPALVMMALVSLVLLIACANAATLILVKSGTRQKEFAVRISMGATRGRLIRQLIVESVLLAAAGGLLGLVLASWGVDSLLQMLASGPNPVRLSVAPDLRVTIYTTAVLGLTVVLFGLVPALRATNVEVLPALKETSPGAIGGKSRIGAGRVLVVLQVSLSLLLLVGAGLFVRTLRNIKSVDLGFIPEQALIATADATLAGYKGPRAIALYREIEERLRQLDGVRSAAACAFSPMGQVRGIAMVSVPGYAPRPGEEPVVSLNRVGAGYFHALGIPLVIGRSIDDRDGEPASKVAVINKVMADEYFQGQDPLGKTMNLRAVGGVRQVEVIGVVADSKYGKVLEEISPTVYTPFVQGAESGRMTFVLRAESDPDSLIPAVRRTIAGIDANVPVFDVKTIADQIDESLVQQRLTASLSGFFGLLALALACIGLFGVASYEVTRRTNEIGLRMALGAVPGAVLWSVMREAAILMVIGVVIGLLAALLLAPMASELLFDLEATDVVTFAAATAIMGAAALVAAYIPARRASRIDPLAAIRYE